MQLTKLLLKQIIKEELQKLKEEEEKKPFKFGKTPDPKSTGKPFKFGGALDPVQQSAKAGKKYQFGGQRDPTQESELKSLVKQFQALNTKMMDNRKKFETDAHLGNVWLKGYNARAQSQTGKERVSAMQQGSGSYGPASPERRAFNHGWQYAKDRKNKQIISAKIKKLKGMKAPKMATGRVQ